MFPRPLTPITSGHGGHAVAMAAPRAGALKGAARERGWGDPVGDPEGILWGILSGIPEGDPEGDPVGDP